MVKPPFFMVKPHPSPMAPRLQAPTGPAQTWWWEPWRSTFPVREMRRLETSLKRMGCAGLLGLGMGKNMGKIWCIPKKKGQGRGLFRTWWWSNGFGKWIFRQTQMVHWKSYNDESWWSNGVRGCCRFCRLSWKNGISQRKNGDVKWSIRNFQKVGFKQWRIYMGMSENGNSPYDEEICVASKNIYVDWETSQDFSVNSTVEGECWAKNWSFLLGFWWKRWWEWGRSAGTPPSCERSVSAKPCYVPIFMWENFSRLLAKLFCHFHAVCRYVERIANIYDWFICFGTIAVE